jgi:hypothetical protein
MFSNSCVNGQHCKIQEEGASIPFFVYQYSLKNHHWIALKLPNPYVLEP